MNDRLLSDLLNWVRGERDRFRRDLELMKAGSLTMGAADSSGRLIDETPKHIAFAENKIAELERLLARHIEL